MYKRKELSQEQRITWLFHNNPKINMGLEQLLQKFKDQDLDNLYIDEEKIFIPKYADEMLEII